MQSSREFRLQAITRSLEPVLRDLASMGIQLDQLSGLSQMCKLDDQIVARLEFWLQNVSDLDSKSVLADVLGHSPWSRSTSVLALISTYRNLPKRVGRSSVKESIADSLRVLASPQFLLDYASLAAEEDDPNDRALLIYAIAEIQSSDAIARLLDYLDDRTVRVSVLHALSRTKKTLVKHSVPIDRIAPLVHDSDEDVAHYATQIMKVLQG